MFCSLCNTLFLLQSQFNYTPPNRKQVMGEILDHLYEDTKRKVLDYVNFKDPDSLITIAMDGWTSPTGQHIRNFMWVSDDATFFHTATNHGTVRPTGANIGREAIKVIEDTGPQNVAAVVNDNAEAETTSWETIRDTFEHILCTGCTAHAGSLLFKDVCQHPWAQALIEKCITLAKFFKNHQFTNEELRIRTKAQHEGQAYAIILHGATRFAGFYYVVKRLLFLRTILREISVCTGFEERNYKDADVVITILNDNRFWADAEKLRMFLKPLKCFIKLMDHDCHCAHHEYPGMLTINDAWVANEAQVPASMKTNALKLHKQRWEWMQFPIHHITYGLSPCYHDDNVFSNNKVMKGLKEVAKFFATNNQNFQQALREFTDFKNHREAELFPRDIADRTSIGMSPKHWWQLHGAQWPALQPIALRVFSVGTSSSTSERNFSAWTHIWSNRANKLEFDRAVKLVYVYTNLRTLEKLKNGTSRKDHVEAFWLDDEIEE